MKKFFSAFMLMAAMAFSVSTFVACNDVVGEVEDVKAQTTENAAAIEALNAEIAKLDTRLVAAQKAADDAMAAAEEAKTEAAAAIAAEAEARAQAIEGVLGQLNDLKSAYEAKVAEVDANIEQLNNDVKAAMDLITNNKAELDEKISDLLSADAAINQKIDELETFKALAEQFQIEITANVDSLATELTNAKAQIEEIWAKTELMQGEIDGLWAAIYGEGPDSIMSILGTYYNLIQDLNERFNTLDLRVQSLVYVPEYSDHKATLDWGYVAQRGAFAYPSTIIAKATDLKYLVKAEDAVKVAASIAETPEVLSYVVKGVKTRASEAALEIVNVVAEDEYIVVSVVAKNFDNEFYANTEEGIYSAALVFDDETNTRTTEFTNLVPAEQGAQFEMALYFPDEDGIYVRNENDVITYKMVCNNTEAVKSAVQPVVGFVSVDAPTEPASVYTVADMVNVLGYDVVVDTDIVLVDTEKNYSHDGTQDVKPGTIDIDPYFNIECGNPVYDFNYSVKEGVGFEHVGKASTVTYTYTCGDNVCGLTYEFVLANAQVAVDMVVTDAWTVAKELAKADDYVLAGVPYTAVGGPVVNLNSILTGTVPDAFEIYEMVDGAWVATQTVPFYVQGLDQAGKADIVLFGGKYAWNNSYKVVMTTVNEKEHVDYTLTMVVNLVDMPAVINIPEVEVEFTLDGGMPYFFGSANLYKVAFKEMQKYFGYEDAKSADDYWTSEWASFGQQDLFSESQKVNGVATLGITMFTKENVQAFLDVEKANAGEFTINVNEPNVVTFTANTCYGVPVNFTIKGNVVIPEVALLYSQDFVNVDAKEPYVVAEGKIDDKGVYSIIKSDLAKYFNVSGATVSDHAYTVKFEVVDNALVTLEQPETNVNEKDANATYHYLTRGSYLDWAAYTGLHVAVIATLDVNGYVLGSLPLCLVTEDPLTLTGTNITATRLHREDTEVKVFENLVLTSIVENGNLLNVAAADLETAATYAQKTYGSDDEAIIEVVLGPRGVYYVDSEGKDVTVASNKYDYSNGVLVIYGDDSVVKEYKADFTAVLKSRICSRPDDSQEDANYVAHNVHFQVSVVME